MGSITKTFSHDSRADSSVDLTLLGFLLASRREPDENEKEKGVGGRMKEREREEEKGSIYLVELDRCQAHQRK